MVLGNLGRHKQIKLKPFTKIHSKQLIDFETIPESINYVVENICRTLQDMDHRGISVILIPLAKITNPKIKTL